MSKKSLIIISLLIFIFGGVFYLSRTDMTESPEPVTSSTPNESDDAQAPSEETMTTSSPGQYIDYQEGLIASTPGVKILFFHAAWCPQCRTLERDINTGDIPSGVTIMKVDYDTSQALRKQYGVTLQTTLVRVGDDGSLVKKYIAYDDPTLANLKANLL